MVAVRQLQIDSTTKPGVECQDEQDERMFRGASLRVASRSALGVRAAVRPALGAQAADSTALAGDDEVHQNFFFFLKWGHSFLVATT